MTTTIGTQTSVWPSRSLPVAVTYMYVCIGFRDVNLCRQSTYI